DGQHSGTHYISFYCDDIQKTGAELKQRGVEFADGITDVGYGLATHFKMPGDFPVQLYQPRYKRNPRGDRYGPAMTAPLHHPNEPSSDAIRAHSVTVEPKALRTYTPTQAVIARSEGIFFWTPEGRRLYDFTSGVLVANLGHNPWPWMERF